MTLNPSAYKLAPDTVLDGRYKIGALLAEGGFARVYQGRQLNINRPVAIKVLNPGEDEEVHHLMAEKFLLEAQSAASITHPNVVTIIDYGLTQQTRQPYIVMELLQGQTLAQELRHVGPMHPARALTLFLPCLGALEEAHKLSIVHRDLKPSNLFITNPSGDQEMLKLLDFGVARVRAVQATSQTGNGQLLGSPRYLAPEYLKFRIATATLDVYQIGLVLVEAIIGRPLVEASTPFDYIRLHAQGELEVPADLMASALGPVIYQSLEMDHTQRFQNAGQLRKALMGLDLRNLAPPGPTMRSLKDYAGHFATVDVATFSDPSVGHAIPTDEIAEVAVDSTEPIDMDRHVQQLMGGDAEQGEEDQEPTSDYGGRQLREAVVERPGPRPAMAVSVNMSAARPVAQSVADPQGVGRSLAASHSFGPVRADSVTVFINQYRTWIISALLLAGTMMFVSAGVCLVGALYLSVPNSAPVISSSPSELSAPPDAGAPSSGAPSSGEPDGAQPDASSPVGSSEQRDDAGALEGGAAADVRREVVIVTDPPGARVLEFDADLGQTPLTLRFGADDVEKRRLLIKLSGHRDERVDVGPGDVPEVKLRLTPRGQ